MVSAHWLFGLAAAAGLAVADPTAPKLTYLYSANLTIPAPIGAFQGPFGQRAALAITGGTVWGPKLNGTISLGLDWGLTSAAGVFSPDAIYFLTTDDGASIMVSEKGHAPYVHILFETGSEKYAWLNAAVAVATGGPVATGVLLDVWQVEM